jgi:uncharacterized protein (DUF2147 family)
MVLRILAGSLLLFLAVPALADDLSPVGRWKTYDDEDGSAKSIIRITESNGKLSGVIEKLFRKPGEDPDPVCDKCEGERKGQKIIGLKILWGLEKDDDEWSGGRILDPENGKNYKCFIEVQDGGKKLKVRGYLGVSMFGRTQYWTREP